MKTPIRADRDQSRSSAAPHSLLRPLLARLCTASRESQEARVTTRVADGGGGGSGADSVSTSASS